MVLYLMVRDDLSVSRLSLAEVGVGCSAPFFLWAGMTVLFETTFGAEPEI